LAIGLEDDGGERGDKLGSYISFFPIEKKKRKTIKQRPHERALGGGLVTLELLLLITEKKQMEVGMLG